MTVISFIIALIQTSGVSLSGNAWTYQLLTNFVAVEKFFMTLGWIIFCIVVLVAIVIAIKEGFGFICGGCFSIVFLIWAVTLPLLEWITWLLAKGMLANFDPVAGITNGSAFWLNLIGMFLLSGG